MDSIFEVEDTPEVFDLEKELRKLNIKKVELKTGDMLDLDGSRLLVGDSMVEADVLKLFGKEKADACVPDGDSPKYILDYLHGKKKKDATKGFGLKRDRTYRHYFLAGKLYRFMDGKYCQDSKTGFFDYCL